MSTELTSQQIDGGAQRVGATLRECLDWCPSARRSRASAAQPDPAIRATEILDGVAQNDHTVAAYLEIWADEAGESPALHLAEFIDELGWTRSKQDTLRRESRAWLRTGVPGQILETAFFATGDSDAAAWLSHALERLPFLAADDDV